MPLYPIAYDETYFYKIVCKDISKTEIYVGHTTNFSTRKKGHRVSSTNPQNKYSHIAVYDYINKNGRWINFDMILIEKIKCEDKLHALKIEREHIERLKATLNKVIPTRTKKEWTNDNIERVKEYKHNWHLESRQRIQEQHKQDYIDDKDNRIEKAKQYYNNNKETCQKWKNGKTMCKCGIEYTNANKARHERSKYHQENK
jgi:hypothetical protein